MKLIRVLIVDDSALVRHMLCEIFSNTEDIKVVDTAFDPLDAREKIKRLNPDVLTLDIEMPKMDGLSFLEKIMTLRPMPVIMSSSLTQKGADESLRALELGAVDYVGKPTESTPEALQSFADEICEKVRAASIAQIKPMRTQIRKPLMKLKAAAPVQLARSAPKLITIGASTGGVETLTEIMTELPDGCPPIVITQHMPPVFTASFAKRLSGLCAFPIYEAEEGMVLTSGMACIAPGGRQLKISRSGGRILCRITDDPPVNNHKPSVDVTFDSIAQTMPTDTLAIILTGMGSDGAQGLLNLKKSGAYTIGQSQETCIVYGMPQAAYKLGAVVEVLPLPSIAKVIIKRCFQ